MKKNITCKVEGCNPPHGDQIRRGYCTKHYTRLRRTGDPLKTISGVVYDTEENIFRKSETKDNGCIEWVGYRKNGYGVIGYKGKIRQAHRVAWEIKNGPIPDGMQINHNCNNRACVNVEHLYVGTQKENMRDMVKAGRENRARGVRSGMAKINDKIALKIKESSRLASDICREYSISESLVRAIRKGLVWRHVRV